MTKEYIKEITNFTGVRVGEPDYISWALCCGEIAEPGIAVCCCTMFMCGAALTCIGAGTHAAQLFWQGVSTSGAPILWFSSIDIINKIKQKIYYVKNLEYREFQEKTREIAKKSYNYPELFGPVTEGMYEQEMREIYKRVKEFLKNCNSNSDFQEKRKKIAEDYDILTWKSEWLVGKSHPRIELNFLNSVITKLAEKKWFVAKKLLNFLLVNKTTSRGSFLDGIFQTGANCFSEDSNIKTICIAMLDDQKSSIDNEAFEQEILDNLRIINKNNITLLERGKRKEKDSEPSTMSMR